MSTESVSSEEIPLATLEEGRAQPAAQHARDGSSGSGSGNGGGGGSGGGGGKAKFPLAPHALQELVDPKSLKRLQDLGGLEQIARALHTDLKDGLNTSEEAEEGEHEPWAERRAVYGKNVLPKAKTKNFFQLLIAALSDKTLIILMLAAAVSIAIGIYEQVADVHDADTCTEGNLGSWVEGVAILAAVFLVAIVGSTNDYQKEKQFRKLNDKKEDHEVKIVRDGVQQQISVFDVNVGDVVHFNAGDVVCADGLLIDGFDIRCDESGMTGESDAIKKTHEKDPFMLSGTKVLEGVGSMLVISVGTHSLNGKTMMGLRTEAEDTPLQIKLADLAESIGKLGLAAAVLMLIILILIYVIRHSINKDWGQASVIVSDIVGFFISAVTIVVVAVPEGLPMAVTLALAYATIRMLKDNNLVRILAACETMGGATTICSDKTGTLTQNRMTVVKGILAQRWFNDVNEISKVAELPAFLKDDLVQVGICVNSNAYEGKDEKGVVSFIGSKTETALLNFVKQLGADYNKIREDHPIVKLYPFSSERKRMSTLVKKQGGGYRLFVKGASEIILRLCTSYIKSEKPTDLNKAKREEIEQSIQDFATEALRTLCLAYRDFDISEEKFAEMDWENAPESDLCLIGIVGIQDPLRPEVVDAVKRCQRAGIVVRMVTGDNIVTARNIAKNCGILTKGGIVMEGAEFRRLSPEQMSRIIPNLQVLARSSPTDKQLLVDRLKDMDETVAVTGDGTNDGPALKLADVGFAMGITGTEVAKEASDIVLMDDNFASIVRAVVWGRSVYDSVRKFLQFQLTVNICAVAVAFITAIADNENQSVLTAIQLLWLNLIMDTMAALALATEPPLDSLLNRPPHAKSEPLIDFGMWKMILGESAFQLTVTLALFWACPVIFSFDDWTDECAKRDTSRTIVFNTFVFMQVFNEINCRRLSNALNVFENIHHHFSFLAVLFVTIIIQVIVVEWGSTAFQTVPLDGLMWLGCIGIGALSLPIGFILRLLPNFRRASTAPAVVPVTREKLLWENAIKDVSTQIRVVNALRRHRDNYF